jgi:hypothetical protein
LWLGTNNSLTQNLTFTSQNWDKWQPVVVIAWADGLYDGQDYKAFGRQLSLLSFIQGAAGCGLTLILTELNGSAWYARADR